MIQLSIAKQKHSNCIFVTFLNKIVKYCFMHKYCLFDCLNGIKYIRLSLCFLLGRNKFAFVRFSQNGIFALTVFMLMTAVLRLDHKMTPMWAWLRVT